jgi:hypothetical protein
MIHSCCLIRSGNPTVPQRGHLLRCVLIAPPELRACTHPHVAAYPDSVGLPPFHSTHNEHSAYHRQTPAPSDTRTPFRSFVHLRWVLFDVRVSLRRIRVLRSEPAFVAFPAWQRCGVIPTDTPIRAVRQVFAFVCVTVVLWGAHANHSPHSACSRSSAS